MQTKIVSTLGYMMTLISILLMLSFYRKEGIIMFISNAVIVGLFYFIQHLIKRYGK